MAAKKYGTTVSMDDAAMQILRNIRRNLVSEGNDRADMADAVKWQDKRIKELEAKL